MLAAASGLCGSVVGVNVPSLDARIRHESFLFLSYYAFNVLAAGGYRPLLRSR